MSRPKNRKARLLIKSRNPEDHLEWLQALKKVFHPEEIEISKSDDPETGNVGDTAKTYPNEQLEQEIIEETSERLDKLNKSAKSKKTSPKQKKTSGKKGKSTVSVVSRHKRILTWLKNFIQAGYKLTVKAIVEATMSK